VDETQKFTGLFMFIDKV